jgi:ABC-type Na+ efflux pump permease subunit
VRKILLVAAREFEATVATKGFILGLLVTPLLIGFLIVALPRLMSEEPPKVIGEVAVIDPTGQVVGGLREYLSPDAIAARRDEQRQELEKVAGPVSSAIARRSPQGSAAMQQSLDAALGRVPQLQITALDAATDVEAAKAPLTTATDETSGTRGRLALAVIHPNAARASDSDGRFGTYDLYVRSRLDDRLEDEISDGLREAIVGARLQASGLDRARIEALTEVENVTSRTVTAQGERETNEIANAMVPAGFMVLLLISVLTSGQYLLTSTVEEKSNRVAEVLLSAVSPMELMTGKILGQLLVGLLVLALMLGLGLSALFSFAMMGVLDPTLIVLLVVLYLLAFLTVGSVMAAIGAAVNEMREAQTLMTPVMLAVMIPWILWMPISRDPNSVFATVLSFVPPLGNFVILLRVTSNSPPPVWQVWLSLLVGAAGAYAALWFAAKVFRIGLLMFGRPPTFATLVRWARMA